MNREIGISLLPTHSPFLPLQIFPMQVIFGRNSLLLLELSNFFSTNLSWGESLCYLLFVTSLDLTWSDLSQNKQQSEGMEWRTHCWDFKHWNICSKRLWSSHLYSLSTLFQSTSLIRIEPNKWWYWCWCWCCLILGFPIEGMLSISLIHSFILNRCRVSCPTSPLHTMSCFNPIQQRSHNEFSCWIRYLTMISIDQLLFLIFFIIVIFTQQYLHFWFGLSSRVRWFHSRQVSR